MVVLKRRCMELRSVLTMPVAMAIMAGIAQAPVRAQAAMPAPAYGQWYDEGPGCASTRPARAKGRVLLRLWYCEAGEEAAMPLAMAWNAAARAYVHPATGIRLTFPRRGQILVTTPRPLEGELGDKVYLAELKRLFNLTSKL
jgi:hypothetical protein